MASNDGGNSRMQILTAVLACVPCLTYGLQIGWLSPMAPILKSVSTPAPEPLTDNAISWMAAALTLAAVPSVPFFSYTSDKYGRKITIILLSVFSAISWTLKLWTVNPFGLVCARAFAGVAAAGAFIVVPVYIREISQDSLRGALGSLIMLFCNLGVIIVYALGMTLTYFWNQYVYLAICFMHVGLFYMMPESPGFLVRIGDDEGAIKALSWLRGVGSNDTLVLNEMKLLKEHNDVCRSAPEISFRSVLQNRPVFRALRMCLILIGVQTLSGCFAIVNYAASIFERAGAEWSTNSLALLVGALQLAGSLVATGTVEQCGRKVLMFSSCLIISCCMASVATAFLVEYLKWGSLPRWIPIVAVCLCIFAYGVGLGPVPFIVMSEVFSFQLRARLSGVIMMVSWANSSITVLMFAPVANMFGEHIVFYAFALVSLFGAIYTVVCTPETRGRCLEDIQREFEK